MKYLKLFENHILNEKFYEWFGDSKVVDHKGEPLICFHGTSNGTFDTFKPKTGINKIGKQQVDIGSHFSVSKDYSAGYAGDKKKSKIYECFLRIENPLYLNKMFYKNDDGFEHFKDFLQDLFGKKFKEKYKSGDWFYDKNDEKQIEIQSLMLNNFFIDSVKTEHLYNTLKKFNYDGIFHEPYNKEGLYMLNTHPQAYIILEPNQVKSVDNNGEWSKNNYNIYE